MQTFKDNTGREWSINVTLGDVLRVKAAIGVDLLKITEPIKPGDKVPLLTELGMDIELLCNVVYQVVKPQAQDVPDMIAFASRLGGDELAAMDRALWESLTSFFQKRGQSMATAAIKKQLEIIEAAQGLTAKKIDAMDAQTILGPGSSVWPDRLASIPAASPSGN